MPLCIKKSKTIVETTIAEIPGFESLCLQLGKSFSINRKAASTLNNYKRCLAHLGLHYKQSPETLSTEMINDYLFHCQNLHKTPSESFFKHTIRHYGILSSSWKKDKLSTLQNTLAGVLVKAVEEKPPLQKGRINHHSNLR